MYSPLLAEALIHARMQQYLQDARDRQLAKAIRAQRIANGYVPPLRRLLAVMRLSGRPVARPTAVEA
jgi:hypothetical protein